MSAFSTSVSISNHIETHLVPTKMRVHRITEPFLILLFLLTSLHLDNPGMVGGGRKWACSGARGEMRGVES